jgi:hypothetical protein
MVRGRLAERPCVQSGGPVSSTCEPCHAGVPSLARPLRTEPCAGTYRLAFYSRERRFMAQRPRRTCRWRVVLATLPLQDDASTSRGDVGRNCRCHRGSERWRLGARQGLAIHTSPDEQVAVFSHQRRALRRRREPLRRSRWQTPIEDEFLRMRFSAIYAMKTNDTAGRKFRSK